jgi:hypothetical protein
VDAARGIAAFTATALYNELSDLQLLQLVSVLAGLQGLLKLRCPWWIPELLARGAIAIIAGVLAAVGAMMAQLLVGSLLFKQESLEPDSFYESQTLFQNWVGAIEFQLALLGIAIAAIGVVIAVTATNPITAAVGIGLLVGSVVGLIRVLQQTQDAVTREKKALGYM